MAGQYKRYRVTRSWYVVARNAKEAQTKTLHLATVRDVQIEELKDGEDSIFFIADDYADEVNLQHPYERSPNGRRPAARVIE